MPRRVEDIMPNENSRSIRNIPVERSTRTEIKRAAKSKPIVKKSEKIAIDKHVEKEIEKTFEDNTVHPAHPAHHSAHAHPHEHSRDHVIRQPLITSPQPVRRGPSRTWWIGVSIASLAIIIGVGYIASVYFSRAKFTIIPRSIPLSVNTTYIANSVAAAGVIPYELIVVQSSASTTVPAGDSSVVSTKAQGKLTVYNAYAPEAQRLIAGTRLANDSGKIYRTTGSVTIPGYTESGGRKTPGSATVTVVADQPGQEYNIAKTDSISDFRVVAFKGTPRYSTFYARLATEISGGYSGTKKNIDPKLMASTTELLQSKLKAHLISKTRESIPADYVAYDNGFISSFGAPVISGSDPKSANVSIKGTVYGVIFKKSDLTAKLAGKDAETFNGFPFETKGLENLEFTIANAKEFSPEKKNTLIARVKGNVSLVGAVPEAELKQKLAGLPLAETQAIFKQYGSVIKTGSGELVPPWSKVPEDHDRISIVVEENGK